MKTKTDKIKSKIIACLLAVCITIGLLPLLTLIPAGASGNEAKQNMSAGSSRSSSGKLLYYVSVGSDNGYAGINKLSATEDAAGITLASPGYDSAQTTYNAFTEQLYGQDPVTGKYWGAMADYARDTTTSGAIGFDSLRYIDAAGGKLGYRFEVNDGTTPLRLTLGLYNPWPAHLCYIYVNGKPANLADDPVNLGRFILQQNTLQNPSMEVTGVDDGTGKYMVDIELSAKSDNLLLNKIILETTDNSTFIYGALENKQWIKRSDTQVKGTLAFTDGTVLDEFIPLDADALADLASKESVGMVMAPSTKDPGTENLADTHVISTVYNGILFSCEVYLFPDNPLYFVNCNSTNDSEAVKFGEMYPDAVNIDKSTGKLIQDQAYPATPTEGLDWGWTAGNSLYGHSGNVFTETNRNGTEVKYKFDIADSNTKYDIYWGCQSWAWWRRCAVANFNDDSETSVQFRSQNSNAYRSSHAGAMGLSFSGKDSIEITFAQSTKPTQDYPQTPMITYVIIAPSVTEGNDSLDALDAQGGSVIYVKPTGGQTLKDLGYNAVADLPVPVRAGYSFGGWYTDAACGEGDEVALSDLTVEIDETFKLYAKWTAGEYNVIFDANGGTGEMDPQSFTVGTAKALSENVFERDGYTFSGWALTPKGAKAYNDKASYTLQQEGITLYAVWVGKTINVSFKVNEGPAVETKSANYNTFISGLPAASDLTAVTPAGKIFGGWWTTANDDGVTFVKEYKNKMVIDITKSADTEGAVTLFARWYDATADFALEYNDGTPDGSESITYGSAISGLPSPTRSNYDFEGWYTEENGKGQKVANSFKFSDSLTIVEWDDLITGAPVLYAYWTPSVYSISYNLNSGTNPANAPCEYTYSTGVGLPVPVRAGYTFEGWYDNTNLTGTQISTISTSDSGALELWAKWSKTTYSITYALGGGINAVGAQNSYTIDGYALPNPTRTGYTFGGWYTEETFINTVSELGVNQLESITVYAKWTAKNYVITLDYQSGTANPEDVLGKLGISYDGTILSLLTPSRTGYTFAGWYTAANKQGTLIENGSVWTTDNGATLYAAWTANAFTASFNLRGGSGTAASQNKSAGEKITKPDDPTRAGYTFAGWYADADYEKAWDFSADTVSGNVTLHAKWTANADGSGNDNGCKNASAALAVIMSLGLVMFITRRKI